MEIWKDIPGYEGLYKVSSEGRIYSIISGRIRKDVNAGRGYRAIQLSDAAHIKRRLYVHRIVACAFLGAPPYEDAEVNHINCDKTDNSVTNLEWVTGAENIHHAYKMGKLDYRRGMRSDNKTGHKGISLNSGGYEVSFCGKYVGWYKNIDDAVIARKEAEDNYERALNRS